MPFKAFYLTAEGDLRRDRGRRRSAPPMSRERGCLGASRRREREDGEFLERAFGFHHLAVEDCLSKRVHSPKMDDVGDYLFMHRPRDSSPGRVGYRGSRRRWLFSWAPASW